MILDTDVKASADEIWKRFGYLWKFLDVDRKREQTSGLDQKWRPRVFGTTTRGATRNLRTPRGSKTIRQPRLSALKKRSDDLAALFELAEESEDDAELAAELAAETASLKEALDTAEIESFLSGRTTPATR